MTRVEAAMRRGEEALAGKRFPDPGAIGRRWFAIGDPQAPAEKFFTVLEAHDLLSDEGTLRGGIGFLSMGDHFDYGGETTRDDAGADRAGRTVLAWLAAHDATQTKILFGNHDSSRVMELAFETDESFVAARTFARRAPKTEESRATFLSKHPHIPSPGIAGRDYSTFTVAQRTLVQRLLCEGRFSLAVVGQLFDRDVLFTHAAVTQRELGMLGSELSIDAQAIANALEKLLADAVAKVRPAWERGELAALDLAPVHVAGKSGAEGGGLLYHRPASRAAAKSAWDFDVDRPRRFDPTELPRGLAQACGHSAHERCARDLSVWATDAAKSAKHASLRTLQVTDEKIVYDLGLLAPAGENSAALYMLDPGLWVTPAEEIALLPFRLS